MAKILQILRPKILPTKAVGQHAWSSESVCIKCLMGRFSSFVTLELLQAPALLTPDQVQSGRDTWQAPTQAPDEGPPS